MPDVPGAVVDAPDRAKVTNVVKTTLQWKLYALLTVSSLN